MATRGRKPKPTALKALEGNPGKRPLNEHEPVPPKATLRCPAWLEAEAKKEWKRLIIFIKQIVLKQVHTMFFKQFPIGIDNLAHRFPCETPKFMVA